MKTTDQKKRYILNQQLAEKKMRRMAYQVLEENAGEKEIILAGIRESGSVVARNIQQMLGEISSIDTKLITISIDKKNPLEVSIDQPSDFTDKVVIIIDDVANSGRTLLYALKPFLAFLPKKIQVLVLVERTHNMFAVRPDYVGTSIATTLQQHIYVETSGDTITGAYLS